MATELASTSAASTSQNRLVPMAWALVSPVFMFCSPVSVSPVPPLPDFPSSGDSFITKRMTGTISSRYRLPIKRYPLLQP